jgi:hypothetical protein
MFMPESPKAIEEKLKKVEDAWALHAPSEVLGEMTLAEFRTAIKPSRDARALLDELESKMVTAASERSNWTPSSAPCSAAAASAPIPRSTKRWDTSAKASAKPA